MRIITRSKTLKRDNERLKTRHLLHRKSIALKRYCEDVARLISRAQLALSLSAEGNLRFSSGRALERFFPQREKGGEARKSKSGGKKKNEHNEDGSTTVVAILISAVGTIFRRTAIN